jgi:hypothetical protein
MAWLTARCLTSLATAQRTRADALAPTALVAAARLRQLRLSPIKWRKAESNRPGLTYEISALPSKLFRQKRARGENRTHDLSFTEAVRRLLRFAGMVGRVGVEPTTPRLKVENSS